MIRMLLCLPFPLPPLFFCAHTHIIGTAHVPCFLSSIASHGDGTGLSSFLFFFMSTMRTATLFYQPALSGSSYL
jgi:hypothetical protein